MKNKRKKIILLGGEGFVGRNLAEAFADDFDCISVGVRKSIFQDGRKDAYIEADPYDEKIAEECDVLIHLIDNKAHLSEFESEERKLSSNITFKPGGQVIIFSSAAVYAKAHTEYAQRKRMLEDFFGDLCRRRKLTLTTLRLFNIYGKYQMPWKPGSLVANIFWEHLSGKPIEINDRTAQRDFVFAGDVPQAVKSAIENRAEGTYDLGTGKLTEIGELLRIIEEKVIKEKLQVADKNLKDNVLAVPARTLLPGAQWQSLEEGLGETYKFYQQNMDLIRRNV